MSIDIISKPDDTIAAYQPKVGIFYLEFSNDVKLITISILSELGLYNREFFGEDLMSGSITINIQKYIEGFEFTDNDIYKSSISLNNSSLIKTYNIEIRAFDENNDILGSLNFDGRALCSIGFSGTSKLQELVYLTTNEGVNITDDIGNNIMIVRKL